MRAFEIFRAGRHTPSDGDEPLTFSEADLSAAAAAYDPAVHEAPLVVGHPKADAPAYGWVRALSATGGVLTAEPAQVAPEFAELVEGGRFKKRSASFYPPNSPRNPKPGAWYLRHVGFLGAQPPAVKGLRDVAFSDTDDCVTVEFAEPGGSDDDMRFAARLLGGLRRLLSAPEFTEPAAEAGAATTETDNKESGVSDDAAQQREADMAAREQALKDREAQFAEQEQAVARQRAEIARADNKAFLARLVGEGRPLPTAEDQLLSFMDSLADGSVVEFSEGEEKKTQPALAFFRDLLGRLPKQVSFGETAAGGGELADDPDSISAAAIAFQEEQRAKGITVDIATAVRKVAAAKG